MAEDILDEITRLRRQLADAARDHGNGKDISEQLSSLGDGLAYLLERAEARFEAMDSEGIDERTRFVSDLAGRLLTSLMERRGGALSGSEAGQAVDMACEILKRVKERL